MADRSAPVPTTDTTKSDADKKLKAAQDAELLTKRAAEDAATAVTIANEKLIAAKGKTTPVEAEIKIAQEALDTANSEKIAKDAQETTAQRRVEDATTAVREATGTKTAATGCSSTTTAEGEKTTTDLCEGRIDDFKQVKDSAGKNIGEDTLAYFAAYPQILDDVMNRKGSSDFSVGQMGLPPDCGSLNTYGGKFDLGELLKEDDTGVGGLQMSR